jgi:hypothetical protein
MIRSMKKIFGIKHDTNNSSNGNTTTTNNNSTSDSNDNMDSLQLPGTASTLSVVQPAIPQSTDPEEEKEDNMNKKRNESQVGSAMRDLTSQRVALGIIIALLLTVFFTYTEEDTTNPATMIVLHNQTSNPFFMEKALLAARSSSVPDLYSFVLRNHEVIYFDGLNKSHPQPPKLRPRELLNITVIDTDRHPPPPLHHTITTTTAATTNQGNESIYNVVNDDSNPSSSSSSRSRILQQQQPQSSPVQSHDPPQSVTKPLSSTTGRFVYRNHVRTGAWVSVLYTLFIIFVWAFGVAAFAGKDFRCCCCFFRLFFRLYICMLVIFAVMVFRTNHSFLE